MEILLTIWYLFSALIGSILTLASFLLGIFGTALILAMIIETIKEKDWSFFKCIGIFTIVILIICSTTYGINYYVSSTGYMVSEEVSNIQSYDGVGSEKINNKQTGDLYYFEQGTDNNYVEYKVEQRKAIKHYTNGNVKVIKNHTEYRTIFKFIGIITTLQDNECYDIYIPK